MRLTKPTTKKKLHSLNEFFTFPSNLYVAAEIEGFKLYSAPQLKLDYIKALSNIEITKGSIDSLSKLVSNNKIIPCWINSNFFKIALSKIFVRHDIRGMYIPSIDKIIIAMEAATNMLGFANEKALSVVTVHECMHMSAGKIKLKFLEIWKDELDAYYSKMLSLMFDVDYTVHKKELITIARNYYTIVFNRFELIKSWDKVSKNYMTNLITELVTSLKKISSMTDADFTKTVHDLTLFISLFKENLNSLRNSYASLKHIALPMYLAYKNLGILSVDKLDTLCCQELIIPSEVICIFSEFTTQFSKIKQSIAILK